MKNENKIESIIYSSDTWTNAWTASVKFSFFIAISDE